MEDKLISFETGKLAKEKGFDLLGYLQSVYIGKKINKRKDTLVFGLGSSSVLPTQSLLQKWLREVHNIFVYCLPCEQDKGWYWQITIFPKTCITDFVLDEVKSYEVSLEEGLQKGLKLIKLKNNSKNT